MSYRADQDLSRLIHGLLAVIVIVAAAIVLLLNAGCAVKSVLTKPAQDGSVAQETAQLAVDARRAVLANGLEATKLIRETTELVETAKVEAAATSQTVRQEFAATAKAVRLEVGETAGETRCVLNRLHLTLDSLDRALAVVTDTARYCAYLVAGSISLVFVALAWRWRKPA